MQILSKYDLKFHLLERAIFSHFGLVWNLLIANF